VLSCSGLLTDSIRAIEQKKNALCIFLIFDGVIYFSYQVKQERIEFFNGLMELGKSLFNGLLLKQIY